MRKTKLTIYLIIMLCISVLTACTDDYFEFDKIKTDEWRPEFAIPIANSSLSLKDVLANEDTTSAIVPNDDNILQLIYEGNVLSNLGSERIDLPQINEVETITNIPAPPGTNSITFNDTLDFASTTGVEVDSMLLKAGQFVITFTSSGDLPIEVVLTIDGLKNAQGNAFQQTFNLPQSTGGSNTIDAGTFQLDGYTLDMTLNGSTFNRLALKYEIKVSNNGSTARVINSLRLNTSLRGMQFKDFWGYIGTGSFDLKSDTLDIQVLRNAIDDNTLIYLSNPFLEVRIVNTYGVPLNLDFDYLNALYGGAGGSDKITDTLGQPFEDNIIALNFNLDGSADTTRVVLNNKSNIDEVISKLVREIAYDSKALPNPPASGTFRNYVSDQSKIDLDVSLVLPLSGAVNNFQIIDTLDIELDGVDEVTSGELRTIVSNGFPLGVDLELIFTDANIIPIDTIKVENGNLIPAAPVDPITGKVIGKTDSQTDILVTGDRWAKLKDSKKLLLRATMATTNVNPNNISANIVSFEASNRIDISLGFKATINID